MTPLELIVTADGSHTLRNSELGETYHSIHGAIQESRHVFIESGLAWFVNEYGRRDVSIFEVGFGTGLNAWLSWQFAVEHAITIRYRAIEPFPLPEAVWAKLNYAPGKEEFGKLHEVPWGQAITLGEKFTLHKIQDSLAGAVLDDFCDVVFFDAFAPAVQPELWTYESLRKVASRLAPGGVFVTYSAKGQLKRDLTALGLKVECLPGPPGKKEMVRAIVPLV